MCPVMSFHLNNNLEVHVKYVDIKTNLKSIIYITIDNHKVYKNCDLFFYSLYGM